MEDLMKNILLCLINMCLLAAGQIIFKYGMRNIIINSFLDIIQVFLSPLILSGLVLYACTTMLWLYILTKVPLSFAYPFQALAFPLVVVLSTFLFKEDVSTFRWIGIGLVLLGAIFLSSGK
jgi:multidrug transporter EmrE-like cation transporter